MRLEDQALLHDVRIAGERIQRFTARKSFEEYQGDEMLRAAVERQFEIIGEALNLLSKQNKHLIAGIGEHQRIISVRNILIHGYAQVDNQLVWSVVEHKLGTLMSEVQGLLGDDEWPM